MVMTMTMAIHIYLSMFFTGAAGVMNAVSVFRWLSGTGEDKYGSQRVGYLSVWRSAGPPRSAHSFPIRAQIMLPLDIVATIKADISYPEIQRCMDNRNKAKALKTSLWGTQQLLEALRRNIDSVTAATPFAVHYEGIRNHLRKTATNSVKIHSLAGKSEHLRINQIQ